MSAVYLRQLYTGVQNSKWQNRSNVDCAYSRDGLFLVVCFLCSRMGGTTGASVSWTYPEGIRAVAPKASVALRRIISINKINPVPPGFDSTVLVPRSTLDQDPLPFVEISYGTCVFRVSLAIFILRRTTAPPRKPFLRYRVDGGDGGRHAGCGGIAAYSGRGTRASAGRTYTGTDTPSHIWQHIHACLKANILALIPGVIGTGCIPALGSRRFPR